MKPRNAFHRNLLGAAMLLLAAALLAVDQFTKSLVLRTLPGKSAYPLIPGLLEFHYVENTGAAFGMFKGSLWVVYAVSAVAYAVIIVCLFRYRSHTFFSYAASAMVLAGGVGNLIDRHQYGFVVDFIHVSFFDYVFNFADCCITVGAFFLILHAVLLSYREKREKESAEGDVNG